MNDHKDVEKVQLALDTTFSNLKDDPWLARKVLANAKEGVKVKKKISVGFILVIVLLLVIVTALAFATLRDTARLIAQTEREDGFFSDWPVEKKVETISDLINQGCIKENAKTKQIANVELNSEDRSRIANEVIAEFVGCDINKVSFLTIMQTVWGPFDNWTHEQRAWYSQLMEDVGIDDNGKTIFVEPTGSVNEKQAIEIAKHAIAESYGVDESVLDNYSYIVSFQIPEFAASGDDQPYWYVRYTAPDSLLQENRLFNDIELYVHPQTGKLLESVDEIRANIANVPTRPKNELYQAIDAFYTKAKEKGYYSFRDWPLELRAEYSQEITPKVKNILKSANLSELMNCGNLDITVIAQSTYIYGVPQGNVISQNEALALAETALMDQYALDFNLFKKYSSINVYYDITDADTPLWKFFFNPKSLDAQKLEDGYKNPLFNLCYKVEVDAHSGEISHIDEFQFQYLGYELEYDLKWY